jgi:hypothetical protein
LGKAVTIASVQAAIDVLHEFDELFVHARLNGCRLAANDFLLKFFETLQKVSMMLDDKIGLKATWKRA